MAINVEKLREAIKRDERNLRPFRDARVEFVKDYAGADYGPLGDEKVTYLPIIHQAGDTLTQTLVADNPRALISTHFQQHRWFAAHFQRALNNHIVEIGLAEELRMCVLEAFFCVAIMKVSFSGDNMVEMAGETNRYIDVGKPYAEHLSIDNFGFDTSASSWRKIQYAYDKYSVPAEDLLDAYPEHAEAIKSAASNDRRSESSDKANDITYVHRGDSFVSQVWIMDVWLPREQKIVTLLADEDRVELSEHDVVLREIEWDGPDTGPYRILNFSDMPDNVIGVSPCMRLIRLGRLLNSLYRKQTNQARRSRDIPIYEPGSEGDVEKLRNAADGQWTCVANRDAVGVLKMGGVDPANQQFTFAAVDMFDRMAGNLQAMAGLGVGADTLGQDQIIQSQVSRMQSKMQQRVVDFTRGVMRDLGWLLWNDQGSVINTEYEVPGAGVKLKSTWTPEHREGRFLDYNLEIEPFTLPYQSPSQRANSLVGFVTNIAVPMYEMFQQQGGSIDAKQITEYYAELMNLPRLRDCVVFQPDQRDQQKPQPEPEPGARRPPNTSRTHVRNNVSTGGSPQGRSQQLQSALASMASAGNQNQIQGAT